MSLQIYIPQAPLSNYVQMFWYWEGYHPPHPKERILPGGMMELTINLEDTPFKIYSAQSGSPSQQIYGAMAGGPRSRHFIIDTARPASILSVWFKPGGTIPFFSASAGELHNQHLPLTLLWGLSADDLYCRLLEAPTLIERFGILEHALLNRLMKNSMRHQAVDHALTLFARQPQTYTIAEVVEKIALSPTRFIQLFRQETGMSPKLFCRVQRFQQALRLIARQSNHNWAEIAVACGYYDQAHFINEFQAFAGITPTAYAPQSREHNSNLPFFD